jgi:amino acid adenylation domain-containing protein
MTARLCRSHAVRVATPTAPPATAPTALTVLPAGTAGAGSAATAAWVEDVPAASDTAVARGWLARELGRALPPPREWSPASEHPQPLTGRRVLLRYTDGVADLVTVEHLVADPATASELDAALRAIDDLPLPDWCLPAGPPSGPSAVSSVSSVSAVSSGPVGTVGFELAAAQAVLPALALLLTRYTGSGRVVIGGGDPREDVTVTVGAATTAGRLRAATGTPGGGPATVGLTTGSAPLAPVHPLSLHVAGTHGVCRYTGVAPWVAEQFCRHLVSAHRALLAAEPDTPVRDVPVFDDEELRRIAELGGVGSPPPPAVGPRRIDVAVTEQAARTPDAIAVSCGDERLTYAELVGRAADAAAALRERGVRPGALVGVCLPRSVELVVAQLAVLMTGAAYLPMDPDHPAERLAFTTADATPTLTLTTPLTPTPPGDTHPHGRPGPLQNGDTDACCGGEGGGAAYVIYTSGSTGVPKGVVVPHRAVAALMDATRGEFGLGEHDVWTLFHSTAFDFSVWELWGCLMTGGRLVVVPYWVTRDPDGFADLLHRERVTVLSQTPSAFGQLMEVDRRSPLPRSLRLVVFGGEALDTRPLLGWFDRHPEHECRLVNMYGITETTVHVTAHTLTRADALRGSRSVGRPLPGWSVSVRDSAERPVPPGVAGEIHVGGVGVADGYLARPELTAQRFRADPASAGVRYRSGDRGRLLQDGTLEHLGRLDNQVKLRGHRIELDEIRLRLLDAPGVVAAAVVVHQDGTDPATARLAGYVVFGAGSGEPAEVLRHAERFLPAYMVPATVTALPALPLTANGKLDHARLPRPGRPSTGDPAGPGRGTDGVLPDGGTAGTGALPDGTAGTGARSGRGNGGAAGHRAGAAGGGAVFVERVRTAWESVFGFAVDAEDDFFALGGNSLLAVRLSAAMRDAGLPTPALRDLYTYRTVSRLAATLEPA